MGLVDRVRRFESDETIVTLETAALKRYIDGVNLSSSIGSATGAIYLMGYAAETLLKVACYHAAGLATTDDTISMRQKLTKSQAYKAAGSAHAPGHSLLGWYKVLLDQRRKGAKQRYDPIFRLELYEHVRRLERNWSESLRYRKVRATSTELARVYTSVTWIVTNRTTLFN